MVKQANIDGLIPIVVLIVVAIIKGLGRLNQSSDSDVSSPVDDDTPARPPSRPRPPAPQRRVQPRPAMPTPAARSAQYERPVSRRATAPPPPQPQAGEWKVDASQVRRFVEQLKRRGESAPEAPPPLRAVAPPPAPPAPALEPSHEEPVAVQTVASAPAPLQASRSNQWMEALRDRNNLRNIVIASEIIGPPKALSPASGS